MKAVMMPVLVAVAATVAMGVDGAWAQAKYAGFILILVWMYVRLTRREERAVQAEFGEAYARYARRVPGFIARFRGRIERQA